MIIFAIQGSAWAAKLGLGFAGMHGVGDNAHRRHTSRQLASQ